MTTEELINNLLRLTLFIEEDDLTKETLTQAAQKLAESENLEYIIDQWIKSQPKFINYHCGDGIYAQIKYK